MVEDGRHSGKSGPDITKEGTVGGLDRKKGGIPSSLWQRASFQGEEGGRQQKEVRGEPTR